MATAEPIDRAIRDMSIEHPFRPKEPSPHPSQDSFHYMPQAVNTGHQPGFCTVNPDYSRAGDLATVCIIVTRRASEEPNLTTSLALRAWCENNNSRTQKRKSLVN